MSSGRFPVKLHDMLENEDPRVICWIRDGYAFKVVDYEKFSEVVLPKYYRHCKFESFQRQLNLYGFKRIQGQEDEGGYHHPNCIKGRKDLAAHIRWRAILCCYSTFYLLNVDELPRREEGASGRSPLDPFHRRTNDLSMNIQTIEPRVRSLSLMRSWMRPFGRSPRHLITARH